MFYRKFCLLIVIGLLLLFPAMAHGNAKQWRLVHGYVLHVQPEENKIMLEMDGRPHIYLIEPDCTILRQGSPTSLASLRPITEYDLQDALCWINPQNQISCILANYSVCEEGGRLVKSAILGKVQ